ncbi:hypothetical protein MHYP_G00242500 [Metynnis hypsauchen]
MQGGQRPFPHRESTFRYQQRQTANHSYMDIDLSTDKTRESKWTVYTVYEYLSTAVFVERREQFIRPTLLNSSSTHRPSKDPEKTNEYIAEKLRQAGLMTCRPLQSRPDQCGAQTHTGLSAAARPLSPSSAQTPLIHAFIFI